MQRIWSGRVVVGVALLALAGCGRAPSGRSRFEERLAAEGRVLLKVPYGLPPGSAGRSIRFDCGTLRATPLYLRHRSGTEPCVFVNEEGAVLRDGKATGTTVRSGELRIDADGQSLFLDGGVFLADLADWELFWVGRDEKPPAAKDAASPAIHVSDAFMRHELASDLCRIESGTWSLCQHGGGMPKTDEEARDYSVQRAVNPFSVQGRDGILAFGSEEWDGYLGEARVYFGVPREGEVTDCRTLPTDRDMLVAAGCPGGPQVAFGWFGESRAFALAMRNDSGEPWRIVARHEGPRPPLTNWIRLGIGVRRGCLAEAWLDGRVVLRQTLARRVSGPFHLASRGGASEWDDVEVRSYPLAETPWTSICVRSASFSQKQRKDNSDPRQFSEWSRGRDAFAIGIGHDPKLGPLRRITTTRPLIGDWEYESVPYDSSVGAFAPGRYRYQALPEREPGKASEEPVAVFDARLDDTGWLLPGPSGELTLRVPGALRFRRAAAEGWRLVVWHGREWVPASEPAPGPLYLRITRIAEEGEARITFPRPDHHAIRCRNLTTDLFESAPSDWSWIEGQCRMAARWACQNQWNFLACSGTGVPFMVSKRRFGGMQTHEYFLSMRPVTPNDAGDTSFRYDPTEDNRLELFKSWHGWYNRRDLNFSFCCDGRNPLSGYAVVFGGEDNTATRLYRQNRILAETTEPAFLFPPGPEHANIHWNWWKFTVHKRDGRIRVLVNDKAMFDVTDPDPLPEGHAAFWTVRNGFSLAKVSSIAETTAWAPDALYVQPGDGASPWQPVPADSLGLAPEADGMTRVRLNRGCGFHALRHTPAAPIPLAEASVLRLPLRIPDNVALNAFLETSAGDFLLDLGAGAEGIKGFATPSREKGECFQLATMSADEIEKVRLDWRRDGDLVVCDLAAQLATRGIDGQDTMVLSLTLGRTGNAEYALAGGDGRNLAGATYLVGTPAFGPKQ